VRARRRRSYGLLRLREDFFVADVGCGTGIAVRELAEVVARHGRALGFDVSGEMIDVAVRRAGRSTATFALAEVAALPLGDAELHAYRAEQLYQHLVDPAGALAEARRVLAPEGRIVLIDQDWDAFVIDGPPATRTILLAFADSLKSPWIGRQYCRLLLDAGFDDVEVRSEVALLDE
jgi:ubiquinone/menaquinone biosynthesis C-methylase UbiE